MSGALQVIERQQGPASILPPDTQEMRLEVFDRIPSRHIAYAVPDWSCMPLARQGEVLVVTDEPRLYPVEGQWFLIQWISDAENSWRYGRDRVGQTIGIPREIKPDLWGYGPPCKRGPGVVYCGDFGFSFEQMTNYIRGKVVGIYRPSGSADPPDSRA